MAHLSPEIKEIINNLQEQLLNIVNDSKRSEFIILERFGETNTTVIALDELTEIALQASDLYSQLSKLKLQVAQAQLTLTPDMLNLLIAKVETSQNRTPALERSVTEIKLDWSL
jgi:methyl-accepting chemotaxis protein